MDSEWISGRAAATLLLAELGLPREQSRRLLLAGFAGPAMPAGGAQLHRRSAVQALMDREPIRTADLHAVCPRGTFVLRTWRGVDVAAPLGERLAGLRLHWRMSPWACVLIQLAIDHRGWFPFLATVSGFVAVGAEIRGLSAYGRDEVRLEVTPPGDWYDELHGRHLWTGRGGPWVLWPTVPRGPLQGRPLQQ